MSWSGLERLDLRALPLSLPGSRLFVVEDDDGLHLCSAEYEVRHSDSRLLESIEVDGELHVTPAGLSWDDGRVWLEFADSGVVVIGNSGDDTAEVGFTVSGERQVHHLSAGSGLRVDVHSAVSVRELADCQRSGAAEAAWQAWFAKCPQVSGPWQSLVNQCWYVLGVNLLHLRWSEEAARPVVVPSVLGYVGVWLWDSYFIAIGLRHGDLELARTQIDVVLGHPTAEGQLQDVVHDGGLLRGFADLPPAEIDSYSKASGLAVEKLLEIAITKPPLGAWALRKLLGAEPDAEARAWAARLLPTLALNHQWWLQTARHSSHGLPCYQHPYSSGLDDSPVFDSPGPATSPDLLSYLLLQHDELEHLAELCEGAVAPGSEAALESALERLWDAELGRYITLGERGPATADTVLGFLPWLTGRLSADRSEQMIVALADPGRFGGDWRVPTVSRSDASFSETRMWRGPVWLATNYLVIEGLERSGFSTHARELAEQTLGMVAASGGAFEYYQPGSGQPSPSAVPCFSWTAALAIDLAVRFPEVR